MINIDNVPSEIHIFVSVMFCAILRFSGVYDCKVLNYSAKLKQNMWALVFETTEYDGILYAYDAILRKLTHFLPVPYSICRLYES